MPVGLPVDIIRERLVERRLLSLIEEICAAHLVTVDDVLGRARTVPLPKVRAAIYQAIRKATGWSYPAIGWLFDRDHTTIMLQIGKHCANGPPVPPRKADLFMGEIPEIPDLIVRGR